MTEEDIAIIVSIEIVDCDIMTEEDIAIIVSNRVEDCDIMMTGWNRR
jgi:hypothetical protein